MREFETEDGEYKTVLEGIDEIIDEAFEKRLFFRFRKVATPSTEINVEDYKTFNPFSRDIQFEDSLNMKLCIVGSSGHYHYVLTL